MQTKFAPIVPPKLLPKLKEKGHLGNYNLLLVQEVLEDLGLFNSVFFDHESFNILDNGVVETGQPADVRDMLRAAISCNASLVILPDVIENTNATLKVIDLTYPAYRDIFKGTRIKYMAVPQGRDLQEFIFCAKRIHDICDVAMWGIPRSIVKQSGSRSASIFHLNREYPQIPIHLLGFSNNMIDDVSCTRHMPVVGIDSSLPCLLGGAGWSIALDPKIEGRSYRQHDKKGRRVWDEMKWTEFIGDNIQTVRDWIGEEAE